MDTRTIAILALVIAVISAILGAVHAFARVPPAHQGNGFP